MVDLINGSSNNIGKVGRKNGNPHHIDARTKSELKLQQLNIDLSVKKKSCIRNSIFTPLLHSSPRTEETSDPLQLLPSVLHSVLG